MHVPVEICLFSDQKVIILPMLGIKHMLKDAFSGYLGYADIIFHL